MWISLDRDGAEVKFRASEAALLSNVNTIEFGVKPNWFAPVSCAIAGFNNAGNLSVRLGIHHSVDHRASHVGA
jgi:hypothetical protein